MKGELPRHYDHVVRIGVEADPRDEAAFLAVAGGRPWQTRRVGPGRYDVHIAVAGAALGATGVALAECHQAMDKAGSNARVVCAARLLRRSQPSRRYLVLPKGRMPEREWLAAPARGLLAWWSRGTIQAASLEEARSRLPDFAERNPEAGPPTGLMVAGPPDPPDAPSPGSAPAEHDPWSDWRFLLAAAAAIAAGALFLGLYSAFWMPEGITRWLFAGILAAGFCVFGLWQMLRRVPEGRINTWLPVALAALATPLAVALSNSSYDTYLETFGITPGEVAPTGAAGRLFALSDTLPPVLFVLLFSLGVFGLLRYFHVGRRGVGFVPQLLSVGVVGLYGLATLYLLLTAMAVSLERSVEVGAEHAAHYRDQGGEPLGHAGVLPSAVCAVPDEDPVTRIGPPLTTDRPVLYFEGTDGVDLLWDREHGLTKVPRFSVSLTPVPDLDAECPEQEATA
ncbi:hypothetical protein IDM40_06680 [Nocardiopsis sp. HNM0947]|uniref:Uncharacterized protein n=1 Tax=Nocardiopsis coralli TaxID=2772213 RepID=A0ABR9P3K6_9ACTN|nr:hypothetical protein [Nocardiopsis coralli]MBE2998392.1 hypothetical protein [Nocardiopsis coralli]